MARFDKFAAAKKDAKKRGSLSTQMLLLNAIEQADSKCYCLLDTGANALVLPRRDSMKGSEAKCTVRGGGVVSGMVVQVVACDGEEYHAVAIEGASLLRTRGDQLRHGTCRRLSCMPDCMAIGTLI